MINCPHCLDSENPDDASYCESCGKPLRSLSMLNEGENKHAHQVARADRIEIDNSMAGVTDIGRRHAINQDAFACARITGHALMAVSDGVSSSFDSETASALACQSWMESTREALSNGLPPLEAMRLGFEKAHQSTLALNYDPACGLDEPEATLVCAIISPDGIAVIGWAGDSRAYALRSDGQPGRALTRDDSWLTSAIDAGWEIQLAHQDPRAHAITQCIGTRDQSPEPHFATIELNQGEHILLCSDGLWNYFDEPSSIAESLQAHPRRALDACCELAARANACGGRDNITVALLFRG